MTQALRFRNSCAGGTRTPRTELNGLTHSFIRARDAALFAPNLISQGNNLSNIALPQLNQITDLAPSPHVGHWPTMAARCAHTNY